MQRIIFSFGAISGAVCFAVFVTGAMMAGLITTMSMVGPRRMAPVLKKIYA